MSTEQEWLDALRAGDKKSYEALYRRYYRMVESLILRMGGSHTDAQDIFQEAVFALLQTIRKPGFELKGKISTLLYAIARNRWLKHKAAEKIQTRPLEGLAEQLPEENDGEEKRGKEALIELVGQGMQQLEDDCRSLIRYAFYQKLSHAEIARLMGYKEAFVRVKKFRCLEYLRRIVSNKGKSS